MGCDHFLVRGLWKVTGEFSLMCLGYNLIRARILLGFDGLLGLMRAPWRPHQSRKVISFVSSPESAIYP